MRDPHIGSFGVAAIVLQLAAKLVLLHLLLPGGWPVLIAICAAARLGPLIWARALPPLRAEGLGASIAGASRFRNVLGW
ncbi:adenosylcobinamide-GDP ribazoletransferase [Qipengyuania spongiae]|uniref:Adenosylcobinamide-GDP ribazoletransferase n=2 Tax=Qipengyuania spongiae TaxID=2909673 RepID=A0ABY5T3K6_9SPHN|nr:adenosylcobinamide-GDP ribazoletransferase [Qipengyuania spongiae]UVI40706.1 adenosylcobinamide-GDP ribazoletransferase [Qipengyuania spongiae]